MHCNVTTAQLQCLGGKVAQRTCAFCSSLDPGAHLVEAWEAWEAWAQWGVAMKTLHQDLATSLGHRAWVAWGAVDPWEVDMHDAPALSTTASSTLGVPRMPLSCFACH